MTRAERPGERIAPAPTVPPRFLANHSAYRSFGAQRSGRLGVGFILKPGRTIDALDMHPEHYSAVYCLRGSGTYTDSQGNAWPLRPGSLFHRFTDGTHSSTFDPGCDWAENWIALPAGLAEALFREGLIDRRRPVIYPGIDLGVLGELADLVDVLDEAPESELPRHAMRTIDLLVNLCHRDLGREEPDPHRALVDRACRRLAEDPRLELDRLSRELGLSYERFRKVFREHMRVSPGEYRIRRRIDRARTLLQTSADPIKTVAEILGYPNPYAFSSQFKQLVGESPEAYRRRH
ncbi:MAG: helix-turn-helix transcriptional regulator [Planctomycetes bacterium]|nr:helix-turn-helix transcriptional regulator [Planctomycetota bacterium]